MQKIKNREMSNFKSFGVFYFEGLGFSNSMEDEILMDVAVSLDFGCELSSLDVMKAVFFDVIASLVFDDKVGFKERGERTVFFFVFFFEKNCSRIPKKNIPKLVAYCYSEMIELL